MSFASPFLLLALAGAAPLIAAPSPVISGPVVFAQLTLRHRVVIRVPRMPEADPATVAAPHSVAPPVRWIEKGREKCVAMAEVVGAAFQRADSVDLVLRGNDRIRAKLADRCPALDFYSGFYIRPSPDGKVCARRDAIRSRAGAECRIEAFRHLKPKR